MSTQPLSFTELESAAKSASPAAAPTTPAEPIKTETPTATVDTDKPQFTDTDVATYNKLRDLGITVDNAQELLQAKQYMATIAEALRDDPKAFLNELRRTAPAVAKRVMDVFSDEWYESEGKYLVDKPNGNGQSSTTRSEPVPDPRLDTLERELKALKDAKQQEDAVKFQTRIKANYEAALDGLVAKLPADLDANVKEHIRLKAEKLAWQDDAARARINGDNFTDLPKYFAEASRRVTAETKAAAEKERTARSGVESRGVKELPPGTENNLGAAEQKPGQDPIWGNISEAEIAGAYKK